MKSNYEDIASKIKESPKWWDEHGAPRYAPFKPSLSPDIYARTVVLLRIECQHCDREFDVELNGTYLSPIREPKKLHYGDPPVHNCTGDTMNCIDTEVLQVWHRGSAPHYKWVRHKKLEGPIPREE